MTFLQISWDVVKKEVIGFFANLFEHGRFVKSLDATFLVLILEKGVQKIKECLNREFEIKELGRLKYFLGIEVAYSRQGIFFSQ